MKRAYKNEGGILVPSNAVVSRRAFIAKVATVGIAMGLKVNAGPLPFSFWKGAGGSAPLTFSDNFVRADENPMGAPWFSNGITGFANYCDITSNLVVSHGGNSIAYLVTPDFTPYPNQSATITLTTAGISNGCGVGVRCGIGGNFYLLYVASSTSLQFYSSAAGSTSTIGAAKTVGALSAGNTITCQIDGANLLTAFVNGSGISYTAASGGAYTSGAPVIWSSGTSATVGAFNCTSI